MVLFATLGFLVMGYHPGAEDDSVYLTAVKADLNPSLFPHDDAAFFQLQMRYSAFDTWMARFVEGTGIQIAWAEILWQWISIFLIVWSCWSIISELFEETAARWAGIAMLVALFTLPVAGTALYIADQYLHPRNLATAFILFAVSRILAGKIWQAVPMIAVAFALHPLMGAFGVSFCFVLTLAFSQPLRVHLASWRAGPVSDGAAPLAAIIPFAWIFDPPSQTWLEALHTRHWFRLYEWTWYEWLGAIAPLLLFWWVTRVARKHGEAKLARFSTALLIYGAFQQAVAMVVLGPQELIGFGALEPMRYLQLVYVFLALIGGAYIGKYLLKAHLLRWAIFLLLANGAMFFTQRELFAGTAHIELPGKTSTNPWLQAFDWIKRNTPHDAYFALDPNYMAAPGEDNHGFRALAERSALSDALKDTSVISKVPELGPVWHEQQLAQAGWSHFQPADFHRLKQKFGVSWVLVTYPPPAGLACRWHNNIVSVCEIP